MIRRTFALVFCALAFWAGTEVQRAVMDDRCLNSGGTPSAQGVCQGVP